MRICILGWYGSETLGDRAILDGIISIFGEINEKNEFYIGSLYPILTERTIWEDKDIYLTHAKEIVVKVFNARNRDELIETINHSDSVIMGGGPLMDINSIYIIKYAFEIARKNNITTALIGCGYGPINRKEYIKVVKEIVETSDLVVMRSEKSRKSIENLVPRNKKHVFSLCDPAIISASQYSKNYATSSVMQPCRPYWVLNLRDMDYVYSTQLKYYDKIKKYLVRISENVDNLIMVPMHTFVIGGDDRYFLNRLHLDLPNLQNVQVHQEPLTLQQMYNMIINAQGCIGMRYHSIVFQTILNGNNYILDYTQPESGKISSFLSEYSMWEEYKNRYVSMIDDSGTLDFFVNKKYEFDVGRVTRDIIDYTRLIKRYLEKNEH